MSAFNFTVSPKALEAALAKALAVLSSAGSQQNKNFILEARKGVLCVTAFSPDTYYKVRVDGCEPEGDGNFGFLPDRLLGVIKGRSTDMAFDFAGADCNFKITKGKYSGSFVTQPLTADEESILRSFNEKLKAETSKDKITPDLLATIREGLQMTALKDVFTNKPLVSHLTLADGVLEVSALENNHFAHYSAKVDSKVAFRVALPVAHFAVIDRVSKEESAAFLQVTNTDLQLSSKSFKLVLPATQAEDAMFELVPKFIKEMKKPIFSAKYDSTELSTMMNNLYTLYTLNSKLILSAKEGKNSLNVKFSTQSGSASDAIEIVPGKDEKTNSFSESLDPRLFMDSMGLMGSVAKTKIQVHKGKSIVLRAQTDNGAKVLVVTSVSE